MQIKIEKVENGFIVAAPKISIDMSIEYKKTVYRSLDDVLQFLLLVFETRSENGVFNRYGRVTVDRESGSIEPLNSTESYKTTNEQNNRDIYD